MDTSINNSQVSPIQHRTLDASTFGAHSSTLFEKSLTLRDHNNKYKKCAFWASVNVVILSIISYDLSNTCPINFTYIHYAEYAIAILLVINITYYSIQIIRFRHKKEYKINESTKGQIIDAYRSGCNTRDNSLYMSLNSSYLSSIQSCNSNNTSRNDSLNISNLSACFPQRTASPNTSSFDQDPINNEETLQQYLKEYETLEKSLNTSNSVEQPYSVLNTFWNYPINKSIREASQLLKHCQYQLSTQAPASSPISQKTDELGSPSRTQDTWKRLNVDSLALMQWNANLRMWLSQTILNRLITEFERVDIGLTQKAGLADCALGTVGLDRLRKTAQTTAVLQLVPSLPALLPFLEVTANQRYLVQRIRELAHGGCMSEYRWNGGGRTSDGKDWDWQSLPTDAEIVMHLFATYLDTQLMPQPNKPELKPFSSFHYFKHNEKLPVLTKSTLAIQQVYQYPPHYRVVIGESIYEMVKGYNNLFHSILLFLYHVYKREHGILGRVNLGKAGVNMLWIINGD